MTELMPSLCNDCVARNQCGNDDVKMCASYIKEVKIRCDDCKFVEGCVDYGWEGCKKFTPTPTELTAEVYKESDMFVVEIYEKTLKERKKFESYADAVHYIEEVQKNIEVEE